MYCSYYLGLHLGEKIKKRNNIALPIFYDSPPKVGGRRGMIASVTAAGDLSPLRSAEGFSPRRGGGGMNLLQIIPLPLRSSPSGGQSLAQGKLLYYYLKKYRTCESGKRDIILVCKECDSLPFP